VEAATAVSPLRGLGAERPTFAAVAEQCLDDVHAYLVYLTKDRVTAEDLTAETFERALKRWKRWNPRRAAPKTWLCQIARSVAFDHFRSEERRRRREERFAPPESFEPALFEGLAPDLDEAVRSLSAAEREVIALRIVLELDGDAAARVLGISTTACSTRLSRALRKLEEKVSSDVNV
jgi:RNA polymerase sigma factor (sigma-70 family)